MSTSSAASSRKDSYETFLLSEYQQIAAAHFKAGETIASFFKHYLVIAALPMTLLGFLLSDKVGADPGMANRIRCSAPIVCVFISLLGTLVLPYIGSLWCDQVLYAK